VELVAVARTVKPRALRGELVANILTDFPERFNDLQAVTAVMPNGERRELTLEDHWFQSGRVVLKFAGIDSVEAAEGFRDVDICVLESEAVELEPDEYYDWELVGCRAVTVDGDELGIVRELMRTGGTEILVIDGAKEFLIPFAESICTEVDIENKRIRIEPPEGLLDF
jgi:16S rRNA processing protein RimM